jgi:hypothetical protein
MSDGVLGEKGLLHIFGNLATPRYGLFLGFMDAAVGLTLEENGGPFRYI